MKQRLYKRNGKSVAWWEIETVGDTMTKRWATREGGKVQERSKSFTGKGKQGRNDREQAEFMAWSEVSSQIDDGYVYERSHTEWPVTNGLGFPMPMLATDIRKIKRPLDFLDSRLTPKLNGHRMLLGSRACPNKVRDSRYPADGEPTLYSRGGKKIDLPHIFKEAYEELERMGFVGVVLDGEVYYHGVRLQDMKTMIAQKDERLQWHLYDVVSSIHHHDRYAWLAEFVKPTHSSLVLTPSHEITTQEEMVKLHRQYVDDDYEGTILRWGGEGYVEDGRPIYLTKVKDFIDEEFRVVAMVYDEPRKHAGKTLLCPSFVVENNDGSENTFKVTVHGNMHEKHAIGEQGIKHWRNRIVTISYQERSKDNIPTICTCLGEREDL